LRDANDGHQQPATGNRSRGPSIPGFALVTLEEPEWTNAKFERHGKDSSSTGRCRPT
jgi:hypothetical protein